MNYIMVFVTASSEEEALKIADALIDSKAAACVNIIPKVKSVFMWEGKRDIAEECLMVIKTRKDKFQGLKQKVGELHSYDVPEIISVAIDDGERSYLNWINEALC
ncbi:MAG: divalent-cation tolerance protein CutA [Candidatus Omnitrophota bacterium]